MAALVHQCLKIVAKIKAPPPKRLLFHGWSPQAMILTEYVKFLNRIKSLSCDGIDLKTGISKRTTCLKHTLLHIARICKEQEKIQLAQQLLEMQSKQLKNVRRQLLKTPALTTKFHREINLDAINIAGEVHSSWDFTLRAECDWRDRVEIETRQVKLLLHYRRKTQDKATMNVCIAKNLRLFKEKKIKKVLTSMFQLRRNSSNLVKLPDGSVSMDKIKVNDALCDHMEAWHSGNVGPTGVDWKLAISQPGYLVNHPEMQHVPQYPRMALERAMQVHSGNADLHDSMANAFLDPFTYEDFSGID